MKNNNYIKQTIVLICVLFFGFSSFQTLAKTKPIKARLIVQYVKDNTVNTLTISGKYKEEKIYMPAKGFELKVFSIVENDSLVFLGNVTLNNSGKATFNVDKAFEISQENYQFKIEYAGSDKFKKVSKTIEIKIANLSAKLINDEENYSIEATLTNSLGEPLPETALNVQLKRLFSPIAVGSGFYFTDENGIIVAPIESIMPGIDGKLDYEVLLKDSDDYGTIKTVVNTTIGKPIVDESTFDERTMWSPPLKAPLVVLVVPNILIFGIWSILFILIFNLFRISKNKNS